MHNVHTHERHRDRFLIDSLKPCNLCCKVLERVDGDEEEEEGQMWKEEPLNQLTLLGDDSSALTLLFLVCSPLSQGITQSSQRSEHLPSQINKILCKILHSTVLMQSVKSILNVCELLDCRIKEWREYNQYLVVFTKTYYCSYLGF